MNIYLGGDSLCTSLGWGVAANLSAMKVGQCGLREVDYPISMIAGRISSDMLQEVAIEGFTILECLMIRCVEQSAVQSQLDPSSPQCAIIVSTTKGNVDLLSDDLTPPALAYLHTLATRIASYFNAQREPLVVSNACISGLSAMIVASRMIQMGECHHAIVVGGDLLTEFVATGFQSFKSISPVPCRPYNNNLEPGLSLGEGCAAVVLTNDRCKAKEPAVVFSGGAISNDANHISGPSRSGDGLSYAIEGALSEAQIDRKDISFINAHGTATAFNDAMESLALALSGLSECPVNSLKGYIGHSLGASGVVEAIISAEQLRTGVMVGSAGFSVLGTPAPMNVSAQNRELDMCHCLKTASGFGGCNAAIVISLEPFAKPIISSIARPTAHIKIKYALPMSEEPFADMIRAEYRALEAPNMKFFKMDDLSKAGYVAAERLLHGVDLSAYHPTEIAIILENRSSSLDSDIAHQRIVNEHLPEGTSPAVFVYTLPNVVAGEICIRHHIKGENTFFVTSGDGRQAEHYANTLICSGRARVVIYGVCEYLAGHYNVNLTLLVQK